jgi:hypothetical protein
VEADYKQKTATNCDGFGFEAPAFDAECNKN